MFFSIIGVIPYVAMGVIMASMGYNYTTWQLWAILACMLATDAITRIKVLVNK